MKKSAGNISKEADGYRVEFVRTFAFPIQTVWEAITDPEKLKIWFTEIEMDFVPGGKMIIRFQDKDKTKSFGKILKIEPPHIFEWSWEDELATWKLFEEESAKCRMIFTYSKLPADYAASVPAGWHILLDQLENVLNGHSTPYPFGGEEETPEGKEMKAFYSEIVYDKFPELKK